MRRKHMLRLLRLALVTAALTVIFAGTAWFLYSAIPGPHQPFVYMVIGTGSAGVTMFALFVFALLRARCF